MFKASNLNRLFLWVLTLVDAGLVIGSFFLAYAIRFQSGWMGRFLADAARWDYYWRASPLVALVFWVVFKYMGLYRQRRGISSVDEFSRLFRGILFALLVLSGAAFFIRQFAFSIKVFLLTAAISLVGLFIWRIFFRLFQISLRRRGIGVLRTLLVGSGPTATMLLSKIKSNPGMGYRVLGFVDDLPKGKTARLGGKGLPFLGKIRDLARIAREQNADIVIIALPASMHDRTREILLNFDLPGVELRIISDLYSFLTSPLAVDEIHGVPIFSLKDAPLDRWGNRVLKRCFDLCLVIPGILILSPVLALIALAVKFSSPGPVLYSQERVSLNNKTFNMYKFRSMRVDAESKTGPVWAVKGDPRTTPVGAFLRKTSLDELPQLFNVLKGDISLVGPRPERPFFVEKFKNELPRYFQRHQVKGGISGWAQVNGLRGNTSIEERTQYDLYYVENWSLSLDLLILFRTVLELFEQKTAY